MLTPEQAAHVLSKIAEVLDSERGENGADPVLVGLLCRIENRITAAVEEITRDPTS